MLIKFWLRIWKSVRRFSIRSLKMKMVILFFGLVFNICMVVSIY